MRLLPGTAVTVPSLLRLLFEAAGGELSFRRPRPRLHPGVPNFIFQALKNQDINVYGDGTHTRPFCYVEDLVDGLVRLMGTPHDITGPFNLGHPGEFTIRELAQTTIDMTGSSTRIVHMPLPTDDPKQRRPDISAANELFGWKPTVALGDGLRKSSSGSWGRASWQPILAKSSRLSPR